jgi:hypothetical protein
VKKRAKLSNKLYSNKENHAPNTLKKKPTNATRDKKHVSAKQAAGGHIRSRSVCACTQTDDIMSPLYEPMTTTARLQFDAAMMMSQADGGRGFTSP